MKRIAVNRPTTPWVVLLAVLLVSASCGGDSEEGEVTPADIAASPSDYFQALERWSIEVNTRLDAVDQGEPSNDDPQQHAEFRQRLVDTELELRNELADIEPAAETDDAHLELLAALQAVVDLEQVIVESLQGATSASAVLNGPLSAEIETVGGRLLLACGQLLDTAGRLSIQVQLFCGDSNE